MKVGENLPHIIPGKSEGESTGYRLRAACCLQQPQQQVGSGPGPAAESLLRCLEPGDGAVAVAQKLAPGLLHVSSWYTHTQWS